MHFHNFFAIPIKKRNILILGAFKCATHSFYNLCLNLGHTGVRLHSYHKHQIMKYPKKSFDKIIVLERENDEEWMLSQLFQDIVDPAYSYAFGTKEEVLRATGKEIVQHFKSIDWKPFIKERETIRQTVKKEFETNLTDYGIYEGVKPIFFTSVEHLGDRHWTETQLAKFFNVSTNRIQKAFVKQNVGATKWYAQKYLETKNCLRNN